MELLKSLMSLFERLPRQGMARVVEASRPVAGYRNVICVSITEDDARHILDVALETKDFTPILDHVHSIQLDPFAKIDDMHDIFGAVSDKHPVPVADETFLAACAGHIPEREKVVVISIKNNGSDEVWSSWFIS